MSSYTAEVDWTRDGQDFLGNRYSRQHRWRFDGGAEITASASPHIVPPPGSDAAAVDPEEAFVAALASCHMLWFLSIAAKRRFCVERYRDSASGVLERNAEGKLVMSVVVLRPEAQFSGTPAPTPQQIREMHHRAHEECFLANSVKTEVRYEPVLPGHE